MKEEYQRVYAQIDLDALIRNVQHIKTNMKPCEINNRTSPNFMPPANGNNLLFSV